MTKSNLEIGLATAAWSAVSLALVLMAWRFIANVSFDTPMHRALSGAEEEVLLAIWKRVNGQPIYGDPHAYPFFTAYYNYLFYEIHALAASWVLSSFALDQAWLPTIARLVDLPLLIAGSVCASVAFRRALGPAARVWRGLFLALALYVFWGPLVGFFGLAASPDMPALVFEVAGAAAFLALADRYPERAALALAVLMYLAWSFKQVFVFALGGAGIVFLLRRQWLALAVLCATTALLWATTFAVGGTDYLRALLQQDTDKTLVFARGLRNLGNVALKTAPIAAALGWALWALPWRRLKQSTSLLFAFATTTVCTVLTVPFSFRVGAAENYYFPLSFYAVLLAATTVPIARDGAARLRPALLAGWLVVIVALGIVLTGRTGVVAARDQFTGDLPAYRACATALPQPLIIAALGGNALYHDLPWITPRPEPLFPPYNYSLDRAAGRTFEYGGFGGMITAARFAALLVPPGATEFDGAVLADRYRRTDRHCGPFEVWERGGG